MHQMISSHKHEANIYGVLITSLFESINVNNYQNNSIIKASGTLTNKSKIIIKWLSDEKDNYLNPCDKTYQSSNTISQVVFFPRYNMRVRMQSNQMEMDEAFAASLLYDDLPELSNDTVTSRQFQRPQEGKLFIRFVDHNVDHYPTRFGQVRFRFDESFRIIAY